MTAMIDLKQRRRRVILTAIIVALIALGFYVGFFISMALRT
jgi:cell division septal protein FtsQ